MAGTYTTVELGGATRRLRFDLNALAEIEEQLGITLATMTEMVASAKTVRVLTWAALLHETPELTQREVGSWITGENLAQVTETVVKALAEAFGGGQQDANPPSGRRTKRGNPSSGERASASA